MQQYATGQTTQDKTARELQTLLEDFKKVQPIEGQMVLIFPAGVPIASTWEGKIDPILIGAVSAAVKITFQHLCDSLKKGTLSRLFVNGTNGKSIIQNAGPKAILTTLMNYDVDMYQIAFVTSDLAKKVERILVNYEE